MSSAEVRRRALEVLEGSWLEAEGFCVPNRDAYPHQWLWDSCFHAIAWASLGDARASRELRSCLSGALPSGFVPHMRYLGPSRGRGPLPDRSSFTQPPIYAHAARVLRDRGLALAEGTVEGVEAALDWLWAERRTDEGLLAIVHPWESGSDDSPRWDSWVKLPAYDHIAYSAWDRELVATSVFDVEGAAVGSSAFVCAPAAFNAFAAHAASEAFALTGDERWRDRAAELGELIDACLWDGEQWVDLAVVGGGESARIPTLDGVLGSLSTADADKAHRALDQLVDPDRFGAAYGPSFVPRTHPSYQPTEYWRGPAWPQLSYMAAVAARRWDRRDVLAALADSAVRAALTSDFAEFWDPETGQALGALPQGWAALAATYGSEVSVLEQRPEGEPTR